MERLSSSQWGQGKDAGTSKQKVSVNILLVYISVKCTELAWQHEIGALKDIFTI